MKERILDELIKLHMDTLDETTETEKTYRALCARIFKEDQYIKHVNYGVPKDVTVKTLVLAYIMGMRSKNKKRYDMGLDGKNDEQFYKGIWEMICKQCSPGGRVVVQMPVLPDNELYKLYGDPDVTRFNIQTVVDDFIAYSVLRDGEHRVRNAVSRDVLGLPDRWLSVHYLMEKRDGRSLPLDKLLTFMFNAFKLAADKFEEPRKDFWLDHATYAWHRIQYDLIDDMEAAEKVRTKKQLEDSGYDRPKNVSLLRSMIK